MGAGAVLKWTNLRRYNVPVKTVHEFQPRAVNVGSGRWVVGFYHLNTTFSVNYQGMCLSVCHTV